ncbi:MAG: glycosyltransferase [Rhodospirillales bacterium]|nr:glycosyltransferase [Rhodospirillales bacterium]
MIVDGRCLQDPNYAIRGVGQHVRALLRYRHRQPMGSSWHLTAVLDRELPPLSRADEELFDQLRMTAYLPSAQRSVFLSTSPMTHSPLPLARLLMRPDIPRAAIVYDFIPHDMPQQYLSSQKARISYTTCLTWLRRFDHYFPISHYTSTRLQELLNVDSRRCTVTGVSVRESLLPANGTMTPPDGFVLVVGGGDPRKNPEVAIAAHGGSSRLAAAGIRLLIAGAYPEDMQRSLRGLHERAGGRPELLQFLPKLSDEELRACYTAAVCTVAPSRIEGFSIPIVEATANGCPVLASNCAAQAELLDDPKDLFDPDDSATLRRRIEAVALNPPERERVRRVQADTWRRFTEKEVGRRFWGAMLDLAAVPAPAVLRGNRPRIAFLSPLPPAPSGVADYSFATLGPLAARADVEVFSDTPDARVPEGARLVGEPSALAHLHPRFDAVVSVIGNSPFHLKEFDLLMRYGSAAIAHDARMLDFYCDVLSAERASAVASDELGRSVQQEDLNRWMQDPCTLEALFLKEIAEAAHPLIVHSPISAQYVEGRYNLSCKVLPFVPYRNFAAQEISAPARSALRRRLDIPDEQLIIASFGVVDPVKAFEECVWALEMIRAWNMNARLIFVGKTRKALVKFIRKETRTIGIENYVTLYDRELSEDEYRSWLVAADVALQLRTYQLGGLSGAILDCISAALPTVANAHLAEACDAPSYVRRVPDGISAVLVAEAIASIVADGLHRNRPLKERDAVLELRNFATYVDQLLAVVGCA